MVALQFLPDIGQDSCESWPTGAHDGLRVRTTAARRSRGVPDPDLPAQPSRGRPRGRGCARLLLRAAGGLRAAAASGAEGPGGSPTIWRSSRSRPRSRSGATRRRSSRSAAAPDRLRVSSIATDEESEPCAESSPTSAGRDSVPILLEGLARLEYRGYDSAGIAVVGRGGDLAGAEGEGPGRRARRRRAGQAQGQSRHRPHPVGDARRAQRRERAPARLRADRDRAQRDHRERRGTAVQARRGRCRVRLADRQRDLRAPDRGAGSAPSQATTASRSTWKRRCGWR